MAMIETDINSPHMLTSCYATIGNAEGARRCARIALDRAEKVVVQDPSNGAVTAYSACALAVLGESERATEQMNRALLIDPEDWHMRYNFACTLLVYLNMADAALEMLGPVLDHVPGAFLNHIKVDPDLTRLRDNPRFKTMIAGAEARFTAENASG